MGKLRTWVSQNYTKQIAARMIKMAAQAVNRYQLYDLARWSFNEQGFHLLPKDDYNLPIPSEDDLDEDFWSSTSEMIGVDINEDQAVRLLHDVFPAYVAEFREMFPLHSQDPNCFHLLNGSFMAVDAHVYYAFIRHFKPNTIVEIGAGRSTQVAVRASAVNLEKSGAQPTLTAIEPFPPGFLKEGNGGVTRLVVDKVQHIELPVFTSLESGDILFIDSTHALRSGGDVQYEYCEVLPRLAPGVVVHIHDISLPKPYPRVYFERHHIYWNEQYLLQAFLSFNSKFDVIWPGNYMMLKFPELMRRVFPEFDEMRRVFPQSEPASFWIRVKS